MGRVSYETQRSRREEVLTATRTKETGVTNERIAATFVSTEVLWLVGTKATRKEREREQKTKKSTSPEPRATHKWLKSYHS